MTAIVVTQRADLTSWIAKRFSIANAPSDADGGSAAPISEDGYYITADHVLTHSAGKNIFVIGTNRGGLTSAKARVVWRSSADDLALLHIAKKTPYFYHWSPPQALLAPGLGIIHGGMATGLHSPLGRLRTTIPPEGKFTRNRRFKIDIPLKPGDSGGPVVDAYGNLIGINSAVEYLIPLETAIFIDSEANRPNLGKLQKIIRRDRASRALQ